MANKDSVPNPNDILKWHNQQMSDLDAAGHAGKIVHVAERGDILSALYEARGAWVGFTHDDLELLSKWLNMDSMGDYVVAAFGAFDGYHCAARATEKAIAQWDKNARK